jgi:hypothetical protein
MESTIVKVKFGIPERKWIVENCWTYPEKEIASMGTFTLASLQRSRLFAALIAQLLRAKLPTQGQMLKATPTPRADLVQ